MSYLRKFQLLNVHNGYEREGDFLPRLTYEITSFVVASSLVFGSLVLAVLLKASRKIEIWITLLLGKLGYYTT